MSDWLNAGKNKDKDNKEGTTVTKNSKEGEQDRGGGRRRGAPLSPRIHQEHTFRYKVHAEHQLRATGGPDQRERAYRPTQNSAGRRN